MAFEVAQQDLCDVRDAYNRRVLRIICIPAERVYPCRGYGIRQHIWVTKPVDGSCVGLVLPGARCCSSKAMYRNDTKSWSDSIYLGIERILDGSVVLSAFWRIHFKQATLGRVCGVLISRCEEGCKAD